MTITFAEQYRHPQWQRRRLEAMEAAQYTCQECGSTEATLHVHHKRYFKGRKVWEYANDELEVLCEECHERMHHVRDRLKDIVAKLASFDIELLVGYAKGLDMRANVRPPQEATYKLDEHGEVPGIADAFQLDLDQVIDLLDKEVTGRMLYDLKGPPG